MILLDTNFLFALKSEKDNNHSRAKRILELLFEKYNENMIIPYLVLNETLTLAIARYQGNMHHLKNYFDLFWGPECFFRIHNFQRSEYQKIYHILEKYCTKERHLSYTDASLIYLYKKYKSKLIVSFDTHFDNILNRLF